MPMPPIFGWCDRRSVAVLMGAAHDLGLSAAVSPPEPRYPEGRLLVATPPGGWYWPVQNGDCHRWEGLWRNATQWDRIRQAWLAQWAAWQALCGVEPTAPIVAIFALVQEKQDRLP